MISKQDITPFNAIKKEAGSGSYKGMRWRIWKNSEGNLQVTIYPEPKCFDKTEESLKISKEFQMDPEGWNQAVEWLQVSYEEKKEYWLSRNKI